MLKELDKVLGIAAQHFVEYLPEVHRKLSHLPLIIRPGGMGDLVCVDIAFQELGLDVRESLWLIEKRSRAWASYRGLSFFCYDDRFLHVLGQIWKHHTQVINTEQYYGLAQATALLARASNGSLTCFDTVRGASRAQIKVPYDWKDEHETVAFRRLLAAAWGQSVPSNERGPRLRQCPSDGSLLVLIAGRLSPSRSLTFEQWVGLLQSWHPGRSFYIAAAPEDAGFADQLAARFGSMATRFTGSFNQLCDAISRSEEILTMDGGPVHIASFFGVPARVVFTSGRSNKWAPLGKGSSILRRRDLSCQPCTKFGQVPPCLHEYACLKLEAGVISSALKATSNAAKGN